MWVLWVLGYLVAGYGVSQLVNWMTNGEKLDPFYSKEKRDPAGMAWIALCWPFWMFIAIPFELSFRAIFWVSDRLDLNSKMKRFWRLK